MSHPFKECDLVIRGALVVSPEQIIPAAVAIAGEHIVAVGNEDSMPPARQEMRADGLYLLPGAIDTPMLRGALDAEGFTEAMFAPALSLLGRFGQPADCAGAALYLASDLAGWVTGTTIHVDGGALAAAGWYRTDEGQWTNTPMISGNAIEIPGV